MLYNMHQSNFDTLKCHDDRRNQLHQQKRKDNFLMNAQKKVITQLAYHEAAPIEKGSSPTNKEIDMMNFKN